MSKYQSRKTIVDGIAFDNNKKAKVYLELKSLERAGRIKDLSVQHRFELQPTFKKNGETIKAITYIADFVYFDFDLMKIVVMNVKGCLSDVNNLKKKLFEYKFPDLSIQEV